ncbi:MAG: trypsin-like peptidase domain-containing protein, partial [Clostridiales bacterium]|nr:trypsin-like peptidase domain-containing protein [Clostridiales bacterium]
MSEDTKKVYDLFGLSEIDKIQEEIEKDLSGEKTETAESESFASLFLVPQDEIFDASESDYFEAPDFYRETIKAAPKKSWMKTAVALLFICTLGTGMLGFGIGTGWAYFNGRSFGGNERVNTPQTVNIPENSSFTGTSYVFETISSEPSIATISDMVELLAPTVVGITTYRDGLRYPFHEESHGSGIIFAETEDRIFIATNWYIVQGGAHWDVTIDGNEPISARPVGSNIDHDLAVAYIYKDQLVAAGINSIAFATFGDSDEMRIGDVVLAIGNAMGEGTAVTQGIISASERSIHLPDRYLPLTVLQTDAAINYGSSGGPLINTRGEIIGINVSTASMYSFDSTQSEGIGYSISSNIAEPILQDIIANYRTPAIGIVGTSLANDDENRAAQWGIPELGVLVIEAQEGRPAYNAGIRANDVITSFDGQPIFDMPQLQAAIRAKEIGDTVEIRILRNGS